MTPLTKIVQEFRCPEAMYWKIGDLILTGKGNFAWYFKVLGKKSACVSLVRYVRKEKRI